VLKQGDRIHIGGGYDQEPAWLKGGSGYTGVVQEFFFVSNVVDKNEVALVQLDAPLSFNEITASQVMLSLRYVGARWGDNETCHVTLCTRKPGEHERSWWEDKRSFSWVESHAGYKKIST